MRKKIWHFDLSLALFCPFIKKKIIDVQYFDSCSTILEDCSHPGVAGLLIYLLKEQVDQALSVRLNIFSLSIRTEVAFH